MTLTKYLNTKILFCAFLFLPVFLWGQKDSLNKQPTFPSVKVRARAHKDKILLRWAVDQPLAWKQANQYGFLIERITVLRDGKRPEKAIKSYLSKTPLKPKPLEAWRSLVEKNDMAAVIAQCLYGASMSTNNSNPKIDKADELLQHFTFGLMAADQSFEAACLAGWGLVDTTVKANEKYFYRITAAVPNMRIDTGKVFIGLSDYRELPAPIGLTAQSGDKSVTLTWDYQTLTGLYASYYVERSEDSLNFSKLSDLPVTNLNTSDKDALPYMVFKDSLAENDKLYYYRIKGMTCFGEVSPPSDTIVKGMGQQALIFAPNIREALVLNDSTVTLEWDFMGDSSTVYEHFEISQSDKSEGVYRVVTTQIAKTERKITVRGLLPTNYFTVAAVDKQGRKAVSFPYLVQVVDSIPPSVPQGLEGMVNDSGRVTLTWKANTDKDIYGYHVFRGNIKGEEMSLLTKEPITNTTFTDSVSLAMMNSKVYYAIAALDQRFNQSRPCPPTELTKPDKIPPSPPVFTNYKLEEGKVHLKWTNSPAEDVAAHRLFKRDATNSPQNGQWELIKEFKLSDSSAYTDTKVQTDATISYTLVAIDNSQNESTPSVPLTVTVPKDMKNAVAVKNLKAEADRQSRQITLAWTYSEQGVVEYQIYKTTEKIPFTLWKVMEEDSTAIVDTDISSGNVYKYAVRAVFGDGRMSAWKEVKVAF